MYNQASQFYSLAFKAKIQEVIAKNREDIQHIMEKTKGRYLAGSRFHSDEQVWHAFIDTIEEKFFLTNGLHTPEKAASTEATLQDVSSGHIPIFTRLALLKAAGLDYHYADAAIW